MRTRQDAIPQRRTQGPTRCPRSSPETGTRVSEKGVSVQGRKRPRRPRLSGNEAALWPDHDPGLTRRAPQGVARGCSTRAARPSHRHASGTPRGRGPEKRSFGTSGDRKGQGRRVRRGTAAPVMVMPVVQCPSLGPLPLGTRCCGIFIHCPLVWQWGWGSVLAQAAGHRVLVRLVSLTRLTCRPAPHLKRVWSAGSFR